MVPYRSMVMRTCAVALAVWALSLAAESAIGQAGWLPLVGENSAITQPVQQASWFADAGPGQAFRALPLAVDPVAWQSESIATDRPQLVQPTPVDEAWITAPEDRGRLAEGNVYIDEPNWGARPHDSLMFDAWCWQVLPDGLIYRSYQAGVREPRLSIVAFREQDGRNLWDGTLGGRVGLLRYGTCDAIYPQGWQLDVEAAAIVRLTLDEIRDFETADYRVGVPLTYGIDNWQFKFAVYHLSSHLGDEFAIANPGSLDDRINYVRDALVVGASYYPHPAWRVYSEAAYAVNVDGGAEPWEFQFGTELSRPGPTGLHGTPFLAVNGHVREEHNFGGDVSAQTGWLWRGQEGEVMRMGVHYFNGKSSQYQTFDDSEQQIGFGLWYDY
jgi:hypothetical protein